MFMKKMALAVILTSMFFHLEPMSFRSRNTISPSGDEPSTSPFASTPSQDITTSRPAPTEDVPLPISLAT